MLFVPLLHTKIDMTASDNVSVTADIIPYVLNVGMDVRQYIHEKVPSGGIIVDGTGLCGN